MVTLSKYLPYCVKPVQQVFSKATYLFNFERYGLWAIFQLKKKQQKLYPLCILEKLTVCQVCHTCTGEALTQEACWLHIYINK